MNLNKEALPSSFFYPKNLPIALSQVAASSNLTNPEPFGCPFMVSISDLNTGPT